MKKTVVTALAVAAGVAAVLIACNGGDSPTTSTQPAPVAEATPAPPAATVAPSDGVVLGPDFDVRFGLNASFALTSNASTTQYLEAYITNFDDQGTPIAPKRTATVQTGGTWEVNFDRTCVQLDVAYAGGNIFAHAFYNEKGRVSSPQNLTGCKTQPTPTPSPTTPVPTPSPSPSVDPQCTDCTPVDVCPNIEGAQATIPEGLELVEGECVETRRECQDTVTDEWINSHFTMSEITTPGSTYALYLKGTNTPVTSEFDQNGGEFPYANNGTELCLKFRHPAVAATEWYYEYPNSNGISKTACSVLGGSWVGQLVPLGTHICKFSSDKGPTAGELIVVPRVGNNAISESFEQVKNGSVAACAKADCGQLTLTWHGVLTFSCTEKVTHSCPQQ